MAPAVLSVWKCAMLLGDRIRSEVVGIEKLKMFYGMRRGNDDRTASFLSEDRHGTGEAEVKDCDVPED